MRHIHRHMILIATNRDNMQYKAKKDQLAIVPNRLNCIVAIEFIARKRGHRSFSLKSKRKPNRNETCFIFSFPLSVTLSFCCYFFVILLDFSIRMRLPWKNQTGKMRCTLALTSHTDNIIAHTRPIGCHYKTSEPHNCSAYSNVQSIGIVIIMVVIALAQLSSAADAICKWNK